MTQCFSRKLMNTDLHSYGPCTVQALKWLMRSASRRHNLRTQVYQLCSSYQSSYMYILPIFLCFLPQLYCTFRKTWTIFMSLYTSLPQAADLCSLNATRKQSCTVKLFQSSQNSIKSSHFLQTTFLFFNQEYTTVHECVVHIPDMSRATCAQVTFVLR